VSGGERTENRAGARRFRAWNEPTVDAESGESGAHGANGGAKITGAMEVQRDDGEVRDGQNIRRTVISGQSDGC
jgi:hypothetical protein